MDEINTLYTDLQKLVNCGTTIPILENDPYKMNETEFAEFYQNLIAEYQMITKQDTLSLDEIAETSGRAVKVEEKKPNRVGISITPMSSRILSCEKDPAKYLTIPKKRAEEFMSPVSAAFGSYNQGDMDDLGKLLQQLS